MTQLIDAIYEDGVLKPTEALNLPQHSRVRISVEVVEPRPGSPEAVKRFLDHAKATRMTSTEPHLTRDQLHERR